MILLSLLGASSASSTGCRRGVRPPETLFPVTDPEDSPAKPGVLPVVVSSVPPSCTVPPPDWLVPLREGPTERTPAYDSVTSSVSPEGLWVAWNDRRASLLVVRAPSGESAAMPLGDGETQPPSLAAFGHELVAVLSTQHGTTRAHRVLRVHGASIIELFTQAERADDDFDAAIVPLGDGALVVWTEPTQAGTSAVMGQFVPHAALHGGPIAPPAPRVLTPPEQDAGDPVLIPRSDGTAVLAWLSAHEVDDVIANATTADVVVRTIDASGHVSTPPVQISPGPGNRFGVCGAVSANATWIAYRVAGDADQESQGDGGSFAIVRLGTDLHPTASPAYVTSREGSPSGSASVLPDAAGGVTVFWAEREGDELRTLRRSTEPDGSLLRPENSEPDLRGTVPVGGEAAHPWVLFRGNHGEPGVVRVSCPVIPVQPRRPRDS